MRYFKSKKYYSELIREVEDYWGNAIIEHYWHGIPRESSWKIVGNSDITKCFLNSLYYEISQEEAEEFINKYDMLYELKK